MASILILYSTTDGHTIKICQEIKSIAEKRNHKVKMVSIDDELQLDLDHFDKIILGASIRYGKHSRHVYRFIEEHHEILESKPNAFFSVNLVSRKTEKNSPETNPYVKKFLKQISWRPKELAIFAGRLDYPMYSFWDRLMIRLIMLITKGPTDPKTVVEYTDWSHVKAFGIRVSEI